MRVSARRGHPIAGDGVALKSAEHPWTVRGFDAFGKPVVETIEVSPSPAQTSDSLFLDAPYAVVGLDGIWYRLGYTKMRMVAKITTINSDSLVTEPLSFPSRDTKN